MRADQGKEAEGARQSSPSSEDLREYLPPRGAAGRALLAAAMVPATQAPDTEASPPVVKPALATATPRARRPMSPGMKAVAAVLCVLVPVTAVLVLIGRDVDRKLAAMQSARGSEVVKTGAAVAPGTAAAPSMSVSAAAPSAMISASAAPAAQGKPHGKARATSDDPYDGVVAPAPPTVEPAPAAPPSATVAPTSPPAASATPEDEDIFHRPTKRP